jgi:hypothetical protein
MCVLSATITHSILYLYILVLVQVIGEYHMRILDGSDSLVQLSGMLAKLCLLKDSVAASA